MTTLTAPERAFIRNHLNEDVRTLMLRSQPAGIDLKKVANQLVSRQKAKEKLPSWYANDDLIFPPALSVEQASSEQTAQYKASLVSGHRLLDLTGGMGVDTLAFAQRVDQVVYVEQNPTLADLAAYNLPRLGAINVSVQQGDGLALLAEPNVMDERIDWIYLDPHRRDAEGGKVVRLTDCEPDVTRPDVLTALQKKADRILIKVSPLLDIDLAIRQLLNTVSSVHIVAVQGEVKEMLLTIGNQTVNKNDILFNTVNLSHNQTTSLSFAWEEESTADVRFSDPDHYVYEPNAAVMKAGAFRLVAARFGLRKLAPHSHLYTSDTIREDFPGRIFSVQHIIKPELKSLKMILPDLKANLTVRNFPQTVADLRKKLSLREGGDTYILATTLLSGDKRLIITKKLIVL